VDHQDCAFNRSAGKRRQLIMEVDIPAEINNNSEADDPGECLDDCRAFTANNLDGVSVIGAKRSGSDTHKNTPISAQTSDYYSSGGEETCASFDEPPLPIVPRVVPRPPAPRKLVHQCSFHPADILANTVANVDLQPKDAPVQVFQMTEPDPAKPTSRVYKVVLTGGPCGGKTTGQDRLASFFESMGWKVFTVPEAATVLLNGGVKFAELNHQQAYQFQKDLLLTLIQIEQVFFNQAALVKDKNVLIICAMDPSAYMPTEEWERLLKECGKEQFDLREERYHQIIHMVTAAEGAEKYYTVSNNTARSEGLKQAKDQDNKTRSVWVGHPYVDVIDNSECTKFDDKILKLVQVVCDRVGMPYQDRLAKNSRKRKWLVRSFDETRFPKYEEFSVTHDYLLAENPDLQVRIRRRCQNNRSTYTITTRHLMPEPLETRMQINEREYKRYLAMKDPSRVTLHKKRRCFTFGTQYFHLDMYVSPLPPACANHPMMILETYTTKPKGDAEPALPDFLDMNREITGESHFSMYNLSKMGAQPILNGLHL
ncbi:hypothetical protein AAVH_03487, partial [Aphelenchoides avenae]